MTGIYPFVRRQNHDSLIDSICSTCYQTIASADSTTELASAEHNHKCNPIQSYPPGYFRFESSSIAMGIQLT
jgi:hypothetical protein